MKYQAAVRGSLVFTERMGLGIDCRQRHSLSYSDTRPSVRFASEVPHSEDHMILPKCLVSIRSVSTHKHWRMWREDGEGMSMQTIPAHSLRHMARGAVMSLCHSL